MMRRALVLLLGLTLGACWSPPVDSKPLEALTADESAAADAALRYVTGRAAAPVHGPDQPWQVTSVRIPPGASRASVHIETYDTGDEHGWVSHDVHLVRRGDAWTATSARRGLGKA